MGTVKMTVTFPNKLLTQMEKATLDDAAIETTLTAGAEVVKDKVSSNLSGVIGKDLKYESRSTGELSSSLGITPLKTDGEGYNVKVGFDEPRSDGESNAKIANILEYGKSGQSAKPFMTPAKNSSKKSCIAAMEAAFKQETGL